MIDATKLPTVPSDRTSFENTDAAGGPANAVDNANDGQQLTYPSKSMVLQHGRYYATGEKNKF